MYFHMKLFYPIPYHDLFFIIFSYQHGMGDERGEILGDERGEIWEAVRKVIAKCPKQQDKCHKDPERRENNVLLHETFLSHSIL